MNRRNDERYSLLSLAKVTLLDQPERECTFLLSEVSETGMKLIGQDQLPAGAHIGVELEKHLLLAEVRYSYFRGYNAVNGAMNLRIASKGSCDGSVGRAERFAQLEAEYKAEGTAGPATGLTEVYPALAQAAAPLPSPIQGAAELLAPLYEAHRKQMAPWGEVGTENGAAGNGQHVTEPVAASPFVALEETVPVQVERSPKELVPAVHATEETTEITRDRTSSVVPAEVSLACTVTVSSAETNSVADQTEKKAETGPNPMPSEPASAAVEPLKESSEGLDEPGIAAPPSVTPEFASVGIKSGNGGTIWKVLLGIAAASAIAGLIFMSPKLPVAEPGPTLASESATPRASLPVEPAGPISQAATARYTTPLAVDAKPAASPTPKSRVVEPARPTMPSEPSGQLARATSTAHQTVLRVSAENWILACADGTPALIQTLRAGEEKVFDFKERMVVRTGNAGSAHIDVDGKFVGEIGPSGGVRLIELKASGFRLLNSRTSVRDCDAR